MSSHFRAAARWARHHIRHPHNSPKWYKVSTLPYYPPGTIHQERRHHARNLERHGPVRTAISNLGAMLLSNCETRGTWLMRAIRLWNKRRIHVMLSRKTMRMRCLKRCRGPWVGQRLAGIICKTAVLRHDDRSKRGAKADVIFPLCVMMERRVGDLYPKHPLRRPGNCRVSLRSGVEIELGGNMSLAL